MKKHKLLGFGLLLGCILGVTACTSGLENSDLYSRADELTEGRLGGVVSQGEKIASTADTFLKERLGINVAEAIGLPDDATAADYVKKLSEKTAETAGEVWEDVDKGELFTKAYAVLQLVDPDTKVTPEMVNILIILAEGDTPDTMDVLRAVLPAETVDKIDPETNETVAKITVKLSEIKKAIDESDKTALTDGVKKLQELLDALKEETSAL